MAITQTDANRIAEAIWTADSSGTYPETSFGGLLKSIHQMLIVEGRTPGVEQPPQGAGIVPLAFQPARRRQHQVVRGEMGVTPIYGHAGEVIHKISDDEDALMALLAHRLLH